MTDVHRARFLDNEKHGSLKSASFWHKMYRAETHSASFASQGALRHGRTYVRITHPVTCATCLTLSSNKLGTKTKPLRFNLKDILKGSLDLT